MYGAVALNPDGVAVKFSPGHLFVTEIDPASASQQLPTVTVTVTVDPLGQGRPVIVTVEVVVIIGMTDML